VSSAHICSVLVLDDEPHVRAALSRLDLGPGISMFPCATAAEVEATMAREPIDVAIVDQRLGPGEPSGLAVLDRIHVRDPDCFRIIFTGGADLEFATVAINSGQIDAFITKPWDDAQVLSLIHQGAEACLLRRHNRALLGELSQRNADLIDFNANLERLVAERTAHLREAHERLKQQQQAIIRLETSGVLSFVARGMAHELNNPLAAILGYAQRLRRSAEGDTAKRLEVILAEVERCRQLVDQLRRIAMPLNEVIEVCAPAELLAQAERQRRERGAAVPIILVAPEIPEVLAAPQAIIRVLDEVLSNALAFGATRVELSATVEYGRAHLVLANDGATPSDENAADATKPFFTTRAAAGNRGLGLAIAAGLLRDQDGHLELLPRPAGGASVVVTLPAREAQPVQSQPSAPPAQAGEILIIEDEALLAELLSEGLSEAGWKVTIAGDCAAARTRIGERGWNAVLIDQHLPDGNGLDLAVELSACGLHGRLAIMTGDAQAIEGQAMGLPILAKPFRIELALALAASLSEH
jgi:signal transduction histidine kinase